MPMIAITIISSMSVKPDCLGFIVSLFQRANLMLSQVNASSRANCSDVAESVIEVIFRRDLARFGRKKAPASRGFFDLVLKRKALVNDLATSRWEMLVSKSYTAFLADPLYAARIGKR